ncbi:MAG: histidinol-phosphate aminotransferase family protein [Chitinophagaceae bacterium]|nr:histidinol-phosphate aminotransferase family protein [Chitinophagaceae bacterium]
MQAVNRRNWLRQTSIAALGLGLSMRSLAGEEYLPKHFGIENNLVNLGSNENPYGISPKAREAIMEMMSQTNRYQFNIGSLSDFKKQLATHYNVTPDQVLVTAGSGEGLNLLARHFSNGRLVTANPTFGILPNTAKKIGTEVYEVPLDNFRAHDLSAMLSAINSNTKLIYVCNPANPSSTIIPAAKMKSFCIEASKKAVVLIDEAYIDFLDAPDNESMIGLIEKNPNVLVIRTFSKIHAMAGLRIGFIVGHPTIIKQLEQNYFGSSQFCCSVLSMTAALASLKDAAHAKASKEKNAVARQYTVDELNGLGYSPAKSYTNFLFFPLKNYSGDFSSDMLKKGVILRSNNYADGKWCRVSIGTQDEMKQFIQVMKTMA